MLAKLTRKMTPAFACAFVVLSIAACGSRSQPAPVESLSTKTASKQNLAIIEGDQYQVQAGDTLFAIAFYSGNDYRDLARLNNISAPYHLRIGQNIQLASNAKSSVNGNTIDVAQTAHNSNKIKIDPKKPQGYGDKKPNNNKLSSSTAKPVAQVLQPATHSNSSAWIWPASGNHAIATVGSDGSKRGLDIKGRLGAKVVAAAPGKVVYAGNALKGYGNLVIIKHNEEYLSAYAHNQSILVSEQSYVKQGQQIATMGNSGASYVMLHFEIRKKGKSVDPFKYLPSK